MPRPLDPAPRSQACDRGVCLVGKGWERVQQTSAQFLALVLASCVTLATSLYLFEPDPSAMKGYKQDYALLGGSVPVLNTAFGM